MPNKQYMIIGQDGNTSISDTLGNATLLSTDPKGESKEAPGANSWGQFAGMAGGGLLAYWLANKMFGQSEEERKKGKKTGLLRSLMPYLAAAGGAIGGHYLMSPVGEKPSSGDLAVELDENGKAKPVDMSKLPSGGTAKHVVGGVGDVAGTAFLLRGAGNLYRKNNDIAALTQARNAAEASLRNASRNLHLKGKDLEKYQIIYDKAEKALRKANERRTDPGIYDYLMKLVGKESGRTPGTTPGTTVPSTKFRHRFVNSPARMFTTGGIFLAPSLAAHGWGVYESSKLEDLQKRILAAQEQMK